MPDISLPQTDEAVADFLDRHFPGGGRTILDILYLDIRRPNLHDSKRDFLAARKFVSRSYRDLFALFKGPPA